MKILKTKAIVNLKFTYCVNYEGQYAYTQQVTYENIPVIDYYICISFNSPVILFCNINTVILTITAA